MSYRKLDLIMGAYDVDRFHTCAVLERETVAQHSYLVAMLCSVLTEGMASAALLTAALMHDLPEAVTGDIPAPTKRELRVHVDIDAVEEEVLKTYGLATPNLTEEEEVVLRAADRLAGLLKTQREISLGNRSRSIKEANRNFILYLAEMFPNGGALSKKLDALIEEILK